MSEEAGYRHVKDDFTKSTKEKLAQCAGYWCSKLDCGVPTRGATSDTEGTIDLGEAAHITAASPGGPRYDPLLTSKQRKDHSNGIWLCGTHAKLVDSDELHFAVEELRAWSIDRIRDDYGHVESERRHPDGTSGIPWPHNAEGSSLETWKPRDLRCCKLARGSSAAA